MNTNIWKVIYIPSKKYWYVYDVKTKSAVNDMKFDSKSAAEKWIQKHIG